MDHQAKKLFFTAALFNFIVGLSFILVLPELATVIGMKPVPADPLWYRLAGVLVIAFGWGYLQASKDPITNRPIIRLGILGKSLVVACVAWEWFVGHTNWVFPGLVSADAVFALLFFLYLKGRPLPAVAAVPDKAAA